MTAAPSAAYEEARRTWPQVTLDPAVFAAHWQAKAGASDGGRGLRVGDLYLACACAARDPVAIALFEASYFDEIAHVCARFPKLATSPDDLRQRLREKLFLADPPSIAGYGGHGDLRAWFRAAVLHFVLNVTSRESREAPTRDAFFEAILDASPSAEAAFLRRACKQEFEEAFATAVAQLPDRERALLRYTFHDRLTIDEVGAIFQVHRATAARWIQKAQLQLVESTRRALASRLAISDAEAESVVRGAMSSLGTTIFRHLA